MLFKEIKKDILDILKHPLKLLPSIIITIVWMVFSIISSIKPQNNIPILRFLYSITYSNGGMFGGFFGIVGGMFGKIIFAAIINMFIIELCNKRNPFKGITKGFKGVLNGGLKSIALFLLASGVGVFLYFIFNVTTATQNCIISLICVLGAARALACQNGLLFTVLFYLLKKISKGKAPSRTTISRIIVGLITGFSISFPLTFIRSTLLIVIFSICLITAGILIPIFMNKKVAAAATVFIILISITFISIKHVKVDASDNYRIANKVYYKNNINNVELNNDNLIIKKLADSDDDYKKYRGRLTYTNGRKNKYGQPFPDLMDFDRDGVITWLDYDIQRELSHDPDYLDRCEHLGVAISIAILSSFTGTSFGAIVGALGSSIGSSESFITNIEFGNDEFSEDITSEDTEEKIDQNNSEVENVKEQEDLTTNINEDEQIEEDLGPYISKDKDGDLVVKDPVNKEERVYTDNGDGTYTNPLTGATYTKEELKESLDSRNENAELIRQDENAANEAIEKQREDNQELSNFSKELEQEYKEKIEQDNQRIEHETYKEKLGIKYGTSSEDETRSKIATEQGKAEVESYEQLELEHEYQESQEYVENVKQTADVAIDVLAEIEPTGTGKVIKDAYTVGTSAATNAAEVMTGEKSVAGAIGQTLVESTVGLAKNHLDDIDCTGTGGIVEGAVVNIAGDGIAATTNELAKGKSLEEAKKAGSDAAVQGAANFVIDKVADGVADKFGSESSDVAGSVLGSEITKSGVSDGTKTLVADVAKNAISPDDPDDVEYKARYEERQKQEAEANKDVVDSFKKAQEEWRAKREEENED